MAIDKDFWKRLEEKRWNKLTEEEKKAELERLAEMEARILFREDIDIDHPHYGIKNNIIDATAIIVLDDEKRYHLAFVDRSDRKYAYKTYWGYYLDGRFITRIKDRDFEKFLLDAGRDIGINGERMKELVLNVEKFLQESSIIIPDDYFPSVTENVLKGTNLY